MKALAALAIVVFLAAWYTRVAEGRRSVEGAHLAFQRGDVVEAIVLARAAAEARCPLCSAPDAGYEKLVAIAAAAEAQGDNATSVAAWRAVRAASLGTSAFDRSTERKERSDAEIARLEHRIDLAAAAAGGTPSPAATEERLRAALAASPVPSGAVFAILAMGAAMFFTGAIRLARRFRTTELALALAGAAVAIAGVLMF